MSRNYIITEHLPDKDLFEAVKDDNHEAFTILYERYNKLLYATAYRYLKDCEVAENAVQQVFTKLWESHRDIKVYLNVRNYLFTMTKNYILNYIRNENNKVVHHYELAQTAANIEDTLLDTIDRNQLNGLLEDALAQLPQQKQAVCKLKRDGHSNAEIAEKMNLTINTVKTHYAQSVKLLRKYILRYYLWVILITLFVVSCVN